MPHKLKPGGVAASNAKRKPKKMDRYLIAANQPYEVRFVRVLFYRFDGEKIVHPSKQLVKELARQFNNSRSRVYKELRELKYNQLKHFS